MSLVLIPLLIVILNPCIGQHSYNFVLTTASKLKDAQSHEQSNYTRPSVFNQNIYAAAMLRLDLRRIWLS